MAELYGGRGPLYSAAMSGALDNGSSPRPRGGLRKTAVRAGKVARTAIAVIRTARFIAWRALEVALALVIIFEEWGWKPLSEALAQLARLRPIAALEGLVMRLPPYPALAVFALPTVLLFPLKLVALWLIAKGQIVAATVLFAGAKVAGTALLARIFQLTQPALMRLWWFAWTYSVFVPWKEALVARVKATPVWQGAKALMARAKSWVLPLVLAARAMLARVLGRG